MKKLISIIAVGIVGTTISLSVTSCSEDSIFEKISLDKFKINDIDLVNDFKTEGLVVSKIIQQVADYANTIATSDGEISIIDLIKDTNLDIEVSLNNGEQFSNHSSQDELMKKIDGNLNNNNLIIDVNNNDKYLTLDDQLKLSFGIRSEY